MKKVHHFTSEMDAKILEVYRKGVGHGDTKRLADEFGLHIRVVSHRGHRLLDAYNVEMGIKTLRSAPKEARPPVNQQLLFRHLMPAFLLRNEAVDNPV
ncbi:MAG: hypothetical protein AB9919_02155 [Geobacteraceae bacterium]